MGGVAKKQKRNGSNGMFVSSAALALSDINVGDMTVVSAQTTLQNIHARVVGLDHRTKAKIVRAERDFYVERQRNSILVARVKSLVFFISSK